MDGPDGSAEIVEDFKEALTDLKVNSKPEIDVLTVIAKENTTYAEAISDVLEEHIKTVSRKHTLKWC
jgi:pre-mRNA cleavage complex 2 protein Pcf11